MTFERGAIDLAEIERLSAEIWADRAFDEAARAALKRDGLAIDRLRLTGPSPFRFDVGEDQRTVVSANGHADAQALLDLWRVHFLRRIRERSDGTG